jgi:hypothetical protein
MAPCSGGDYCDFGVCRSTSGAGAVDEDFLRDAFSIAGREFGIPSCLLMAIAEVESGWDVASSSGDGGRGIMQLTGGTLDAAAAQLGLSREALVGTDRTSVLNNIRGGAAMMRVWADGDSGGPLIYDDEPREALETWWFVVTRYNGGGEDGLLTSSNYPYRVFNRFLLSSRVPRISVTFPPVMTSRASTSTERARGEANSNDADLQPPVPDFHIRVVSEFNVNDLEWHTCDGEAGTPSVSPGDRPRLENLQTNRTLPSGESFAVGGRVVSPTDELQVVTLAVTTPRGVTDNTVLRAELPSGRRTFELNTLRFDPADFGGGSGLYVVGVWARTATRTADLFG